MVPGSKAWIPSSSLLHPSAGLRPASGPIGVRGPLGCERDLPWSVEHVLSARPELSICQAFAQLILTPPGGHKMRLSLRVTGTCCLRPLAVAGSLLRLHRLPEVTAFSILPPGLSPRDLPLPFLPPECRFLRISCLSCLLKGSQSCLFCGSPPTPPNPGIQFVQKLDLRSKDFSPGAHAGSLAQDQLYKMRQTHKQQPGAGSSPGLSECLSLGDGGSACGPLEVAMETKNCLLNIKRKLLCPGFEFQYFTLIVSLE